MAVDSGGYSEKELLRMIRRWVSRKRAPKRVRVKDTADFFRVDYDDVVLARFDGLKTVEEFERRGKPPVFTHAA